MPISRIEILKGKSDEYKKTLFDVVHKALVDCIKKPDADRRQIIYEHESINFEKVGKSDDFVFIEILLIKGRSAEAKKKLFAQIVTELHQKLSIPKDDITILLNEQAPENWGIRGGKPASEFEMTFV